MQAVILAAGKSTRTYPLTLTRPKPLLKVANKTLLEHNLDNLIGLVDEIIIIVGYKKNLIKKYMGYKYKNIKIRYVDQKQQLGTAHATSLAEPYIKGRFILFAGDDIYSKPDMKNCAKMQNAVLTARVKNPRDFGVILAKNNILIDFVEKPKTFVSDLISTSFYSFGKKIFSYINKIKKSARNEFELPDAVKLMSKDEKFYCIASKHWLPIGYPCDLLNADRILRKGKNLIGKNSRVYGNIKNSSIGNNCVIKGNVKNSIIMDNTLIDKNSVVEDSVIGDNVHFRGKIISMSTSYSTVNGKKIKVDRLGVIIGDNVTAINVKIKAGCKIWPNKKINNRIIMHDIV